MYTAGRPHLSRPLAISSALVFCAAAADAQVPLKSSVVLLGATATNDAISLPVRSGELAEDLYFQVERPLTRPDGTVMADPSGSFVGLPLQATTPPADVVPITLALAGRDPAPASGPLSIPLAMSSIQRVIVRGAALRRGTTYKGALVLSAAGQSHRWEITLTTAGRGVLKAIPLGPLQFTSLPPFRTMGSFPVTLSNRSDIGAYHNLRAYFEGSGAAPSKAIRSNVVTDIFSFFDDEGRTRPLALDRERSGVTIEGDRQVWVEVTRLDPGEYTGGLRFAADETIIDTDDSKLSLIIQVRHHWLMPVLVLLAGSVVGWFSTKYAVAVRKSRELARQIRDLRARADHLARREGERAGWMFPSETSSFALIKVRVTLSQLARLIASPAVMLTREEEILKRRQDAELRLSKLERLRETRLRVQPVADVRPAAQVAIGRLLRQAVNVLEEPVLDEGRVAEFAALLQKVDQWAAPETFLAQYRAALLVRRRSPDIPAQAALAALPVAVRDRLSALLQKCPAESAFSDASVDTLQQHDQLIGEIVLLWQEREREWGERLAVAGSNGATLQALFDLADRSFWDYLKTQRFSISLDTTSEQGRWTFNLVEVSLIPPADVSAARMRRHPLRVEWRVTTADGTRTTESDGLTLVQYFSAPGKVEISARLRYAGEEIPVAAAGTTIALSPPLEIVSNPEYRIRRFFYGFTEWVPLLIATVFAIATAMSAQYDSTFGSYGQYLALFIWAAGAATGGNMFKQLGTAAVPGGSTDTTLPQK